MTKIFETLFVWFAMALLAYLMLLLATMTTVGVLDMIDYYRVKHARNNVILSEMATPPVRETLLLE